MIPLSVEAKLVTIVVLALLNLLLLKRKRSDDTVESYLLEGNGYNFNGGNGQSDSFSKKQIKGEKLGNEKEGKQEGVQKQLLNESKDNEKLLFVRLPKENNIQKHVQNSLQSKHQNETFYQINTKNIPETKPIQQVETPQLTKETQNTQINIFTQPLVNPPISKPQIPNLTLPLPTPIQQQPICQQFHDILDEIKSDKKSCQIPNKFANPLYSERKYIQKKFIVEPESESDSNTKKTQINMRLKEKSECKNHCQCCKQSQAPREILKRSLQDLIYSTFEEMIEKNTIEQNFGNKKKKRSL